MNNKELASRAKFAETNPKAAGAYVPKSAKTKALGKKRGLTSSKLIKMGQRGEKLPEAKGAKELREHLSK